MKKLAQAFFYIVLLFWIVALLKMILIYIHWDAKTIFFAGCILMSFGFIPGILFSYWEKSKKNLVWILLVSITISILAYLAGTKSGLNSFLPNFWIAALLQALALGILSLLTTERKMILIIWLTWLVFSSVLMTIHLLDGTL